MVPGEDGDVSAIAGPACLCPLSSQMLAQDSFACSSGCKRAVHPQRKGSPPALNPPGHVPSPGEESRGMAGLQHHCSLPHFQPRAVASCCLRSQAVMWLSPAICPAVGLGFFVGLNPSQVCLDLAWRRGLGHESLL